MRITDKYTLPGVQRLIRQLMDNDGLSPMELAKNAGIHFTTLYGILKRDDNQRIRPVRRSTIMALGSNLGYEVRFGHTRNEITFTRPDSKPSKRNDVDELLLEIRKILIQTERSQLGEDDRERILGVVKALVASV